MSRFREDPGYQAFRILQATFIAAPLTAGIDKFFYTLTNWSNYLAPIALRVIHNHDRGFMMIVGTIEIIAATGIFFKPRLFSYIVALWLGGIILNLLLTGNYFDIALRDLGLLLSAVALGRLSKKYT